MLKTAFSYAVEWGLLLKSPIPREAPKSTSEERAIWDEKTMLAALQTMTDPTLHLAVHPVSYTHLDVLTEWLLAT